MSSPSLSPDLIRSCAGMVILTLLKDRPMYGYEILVSLADRGNGEFRFKQGTLYPLLYRLEREGWIQAQWETPPKGKKRKVYSLTNDGAKVRQKLTGDWLQFTEAVNAILKECNNESK